MITKRKRKIYQDRWRKKIGDVKYRQIQAASAKKYRMSPWIKTYQSISQRLRRSKNLEKWGNGYRCYVGIEMHMTPSDLKILWERDNAAAMLSPSIDRINPDGHYTVENCQYIEMKANRAKVRSPGPIKRALKKD